MNSDEMILRTLRLLSLTALQGMKQKEQVDLMDKAGYGPTEIADMLGSTPNTISVRLGSAKSKEELYACKESKEMRTGGVVKQMINRELRAALLSKLGVTPQRLSQRRSE